MINKRIIPGFLILLTILSCHKNPTEPEPQDILGKLQALSGIEVIEIEPHYGYPRAFKIDITQPVDHHNANGQQFTQRMYLSHVDETMPMIFGPSGYGSSPEYVQELAGIMQTNHISVAHRYFIEAEPEPLDWQYLTVEQSAADYHRIVTLFKQIYPDKWISSGRSKGGETVLFHRRFYPDDIDATIAYLAPMVFGTAGPRFVDFLGSLGSDECWNKIHQFQRTLLINSDSLITRLSQWFPDNGYTFSGDADMTLESAVRSYDRSFWQRHTYDCEAIPGEDASFDDMLTHLAQVVRLYNSSDERAVELTGQTNAVKIIQVGADHGVRIVDLEQQQLVYSTLEQWLGIEIGQVAKRVGPIVIRTEAMELFLY